MHAFKQHVHVFNPKFQSSYGEKKEIKSREKKGERKEKGKDPQDLFSSSIQGKNQRPNGLFLYTIFYSMNYYVNY